MFLNASIRDNFRLFVPDVTDDAIKRACESVDVWEAICNLSPESPLDAVVANTQSEGGLSGGQRKRLELARALSAQPKLLMLDEPTTGVARSDKPALVRAVQANAAGRTCIMVEHDLDFVCAVADTVAVLEGGRFVEHGTVDELMSRDSAFARMVNVEMRSDTDAERQ